MTSIVLLGGTGIVGETVATELTASGLDVTVCGRERGNLLDYNYIHCDDIFSSSHQWDFVFDIYAANADYAKQVKDHFQNKTSHIFIMSSTLVYDRSKLSFERIRTNHPLAQTGTQGGYVDNKLAMEKVWRYDSRSTILRPYHIIGPGSYLGCLPPYNRDPGLREKIHSGKLELSDGGRVPLNFVDARDIGKCVTHLMRVNPSPVYNIVNPQEIIARDYYTKLADLLGVELDIRTKPVEEVWEKGKWNLTTLPHLYDVSNLERDCGYVPNTSLSKSLEQALSVYPELMHKTHSPVHRRMHQGGKPKTPNYYNLP